jgi:hypothetical protein
MVDDCTVEKFVTAQRKKGGKKFPSSNEEGPFEKN